MEMKTLPDCKLQRLPLLLPTGVPPGWRTALGYVLVSSDCAQRVGNFLKRAAGKAVGMS